MLDCNFRNHAGNSPVIMMNQLKFIYYNPFKDLHSHPIHTYFPIIASNIAVKLVVFSRNTCFVKLIWYITTRKVNE